MRKHWYAFIILALLVFQTVVVIQPFAYANPDNLCKNGKIVYSEKTPIFCVPEGKAKEINQKLTNIAKDKSFKTNYLIINPQEKTLDISYRILENDDKNQVWKDEEWKSIGSLAGSNKPQLIPNNGLIKLEQSTADTTNYCNILFFIVLSFVCALALLYIFIEWSGQKNYLIEQKNRWSILLTIFLALFSWCGFQFFSDNFNVKDYIAFVFPICLGITGGFYSSLQSIKTAKIEKALQYIDKWDSSELQLHRSNILLFIVPNADSSKNLIDEIKNLKDTEINNVSLTSDEVGRIEEEVDQITILDLDKEKEKNQRKTDLKKEKLKIDKIAAAIRTKSDIKIDLRIICNFWEKLYIVLDRELADKSILKETFHSLYKERYCDVCLSFLQYLESKEYQKTDEMQTHLGKLREETIWNYEPLAPVSQLQRLQSIG